MRVRLLATLVSVIALLGSGRAFAAPAVPLEPVVLERRMLDGIPYLYVAVRHPRRTILLIHGGPDTPAFDASDQYEGYLARRFRARVIKPVFFGSSERSPFDRPIVVSLHGDSAASARAKVLRAVNATRSGMPIAVREVRHFLRRWDMRSTVVLGESFGARLAAIAAQIPHQSRLVLMAPALWTPGEVVRAQMAGTYTQRNATDPVRTTSLETMGELFTTPGQRRRLEEAISLAYHRPWHDVDLGSILRRTPGPVTVIAGGHDRIGMIDARDWIRLRERAPRTTVLCLDPTLEHAVPWHGKVAARCFARAMAK